MCPRSVPRHREREREREIRNSYKISVEQTDGNKPPGRVRRRSGDQIKPELKGKMDWTELVDSKGFDDGL
jgi:hypothetical protein